MSELIVPIDLPPAPHVLASTSFLATLAEVEKEVAGLEVKAAQSATLAANLQVRLTAAGKKLESARTALKALFLAASRAIDAAAKDPMDRISVAKTALSVGLTRYDQELRAAAAKAEAERQAELARLEKIRLQEEAAEKARQDELAKQAASKEAVSFDFGDEEDEPAPKTETEKMIEAVKYAPAKTEAAPKGISFRVSLYPHVEDVNKLPDQFVTKTAKLRDIHSAFCTGFKDGDPIPKLDGVRFEVRRDAISTGKELF